LLCCHGDGDQACGAPSFFGQDFKPWSDYARAIRTELERQSPWHLKITDHSLTTAPFSDADPGAHLSSTAKQPPDVILSIGAPAAAFVQRQRRQLFPATPMLLTTVEQRRVQFSNLTANDAVAAVSTTILVPSRKS
jgi:hypothetical protein